VNEETRRQILIDVAEGRLAPEEAAERLQADPLDGAAHDPTARDPHDSWSEGEAIERVHITGDFGVTRVTGDPGVREAIAEGPHLARREGTTLVIQSAPLWNEGSGYSFGGPLGWKHRTVSVRVNPDLPVDVDIAAGTLSLWGMRGPVRTHISAGNARIEEVTGPIDVFVAAGNARITGMLGDGASRVRCEAGNVRVHLERGSSVRAKARTSLGRVRLPGGPGRGWLAGESPEVIVGDGAGTLDVETSFGNVDVTADER
jgi:hypothetical protein